MLEICNLRFLKLVFSLVALDKIVIPKNLKGNIIRGAFGLIFKRLNCRSIPICIDRCVDNKCLYSRIFEPHFDDTPSGMRDIPRPFILTHTNDDREIIYAGESFNIGFNLFGWACDYYGHFIEAVREMGNEGIGSLRGRFLLKHVYNEDINGNKEVVVINNNILKDVRPFTIDGNYQILTRYIKITIRTPTIIKYEGSIVRQPDFYHLFLRLRDRVSAIAYFHNGIELEEDFKLLELEAREVETIQSNWRWVELKRRSSKTHQLHDLSGVVGYGVYDFKSIERVELFAPWIKIGEIVNVGKNSVWGMGEIKSDFNWKVEEINYV